MSADDISQSVPRPGLVGKILVGVFTFILASATGGLLVWRYDYGVFHTEFQAFKGDGPRYSLDFHRDYVAPDIEKNSHDIEKLEDELFALSRTVREYQAKTIQWQGGIDQHVRDCRCDTGNK